MSPLQAAAFLHWRPRCLAHVARVFEVAADGDAVTRADPTETVLMNGAAEGAVAAFDGERRRVRAWELSRFVQGAPAGDGDGAAAQRGAARGAASADAEIAALLTPTTMLRNG
jgi:hypothetical protein